MIQAARGSNSDSFLREAKEAILSFNDPQVENLFSRALMSVVEKRNDPEKIYTGAKEARENILSYLEQNGVTQTANIWARKIEFERKAIDSLKTEIRNALKERKIEGVVEIHLQDREINSPHIQFVGNDAPKAEKIIAEILVKHNYEDSLESAISKGTKPAYFELESKFLPRRQILSDRLAQDERYIQEREQIQQRQQEKERQTKELFKGISERAKSFREILLNLDKTAHFSSGKESKIEQIRKIKSMPTEELKEAYFKKRKQR
ncbi:hypothetical protein BKH41_08890 [Helicobacter sp. 12S02232-10]|uniref:hypothetical protein n=1 Tax=Helicobacter sp. 12S02232-10 TaxID=1476197 RepID=UPI000BA54700|nr:hypothetical protein [Helicobacter sp. 12S02232-10]PAF46611.1 hypothetical protein BKH41_08890 [Helicobacter sp. 12S02232-10]